MAECVSAARCGGLHSASGTALKNSAGPLSWMLLSLSDSAAISGLSLSVVVLLPELLGSSVARRLLWRGGGGSRTF